MTTGTLTYSPAVEITTASRQPINLSWSEYGWPVFFLLSMALMGLKFPLGYILVPCIIFGRLRNDRYDAMIMLTLFFGGYGLINEDVLFFKPTDLGFIVSIIGILTLRKGPLVKRTIWLIVVYAICLFAFAILSKESLFIQIRILRNYLQFTYFIIPLMLFAGRDFDINVFWRKLMPYVFTLCTFYILDAFVINGHILMPCTFFGAGVTSTFYDPVIYSFGTFPRVYPPGLYFILFALYPIARNYKLTTAQWLLIFGALAACRTFTVISAVIVIYMLSLPNPGKKVKYLLIAGASIFAIYLIDSTLPQKENGESPMRVYSSIEQFYNLAEAQDDEDIAKMGSGRFAQALPKFEVLNSENRQAIGLGFLHPELTTLPEYIINNEYYIDTEKAEEVATGIEIEPLQVYLTIGYLGLIVHLAFFALTYILIRRLEYSFYYLLVMIGLFLFGLGGFATLNAGDGLILCSLAYAVVLLNYKAKHSLTTSKL